MADDYDIDSYLDAVERGVYYKPPAPAPAAAAIPEEPSAWRRVPDVGVTALKGAVGLAETGIGLADIPTGGAIGRGLEKVGVRPREAQETLSSWYSPQQQAAQRTVSEAFKEGFLPGVSAAIRHPSTIATTVGESIPTMLGGAGVARGILKYAPKVAPWAAGAIGEGVVGAGAAAEQIRQQSETGYLSPKQALSALGSGAGTAAFGAVGGKFAQKFGVGDVETALARGTVGKSDKGFVRRLAESGFSEGVIEELPQSMQEQMWQNYALDRPLTEGLAESAGMGMLAGVGMGATVGALTQRRDLIKPAAEQDQEVPPPPPGAPAPRTLIDEATYKDLRSKGADHETALFASRNDEYGIKMREVLDLDVGQQEAPPAPPTPPAAPPKKVSAKQRLEDLWAQSAPEDTPDFPAVSELSDDMAKTARRAAAILEKSPKEGVAGQKALAEFTKTRDTIYAAHRDEVALKPAQEAFFAEGGSKGRWAQLKKIPVEELPTKLLDLAGDTASKAATPGSAYLAAYAAHQGITIEEAQNAVQERSAAQEVPRAGEAGQVVAEGGEGVRPGVEGQEVAAEGKAEEVTAPSPVYNEQGEIVSGGRTQEELKAQFSVAAAKLMGKLTKNARANIMPEEDVDVMRELVAMLDAAIGLGHISLKQATKYVLDTLGLSDTDLSADILKRAHAVASKQRGIKASRGVKGAGEAQGRTLDEVPETMKPVVMDFMGWDENGDIDPEIEPMIFKDLAAKYGEVSHTTWKKRLAAIGFTEADRQAQIDAQTVEQATEEAAPDQVIEEGTEEIPGAFTQTGELIKDDEVVERDVSEVGVKKQAISTDTGLRWKTDLNKTISKWKEPHLAQASAEFLAQGEKSGVSPSLFAEINKELGRREAVRLEVEELKIAETSRAEKAAVAQALKDKESAANQEKQAQEVVKQLPQQQVQTASRMWTLLAGSPFNSLSAVQQIVYIRGVEAVASDSQVTTEQDFDLFLTNMHNAFLRTNKMEVKHADQSTETTRSQVAEKDEGPVEGAKDQEGVREGTRAVRPVKVEVKKRRVAAKLEESAPWAFPGDDSLAKEADARHTKTYGSEFLYEKAAKYLKKQGYIAARVEKLESGKVEVRWVPPKEVVKASEAYDDEDAASVQSALRDVNTVGDAIDILLASAPLGTFEHKVLAALSRHAGVRLAAFELAGEVDINTDVVSSTLGRFFTESNRVELYNGAGTKTFIHEAVHAALFREYKTNTQFRNTVDRIYRLAYQRMSLAERSMYGAKNAQEFLSEAYSNPEFQDVLGGMKQGDATILARFISAVKQFFAKLLGKYARGTENVLQELIYETFGQLGTESETAAFLRTERGKDTTKREELSLERVVGGGTVAQDSPSKGVWEKAGAAFDRFFNDPMTMVKEHSLGWLSMDHLVEVAQGVNDKLSEYRDVSRKMQALSKEWVYKAAKIDAEWGKLSDNEAKHLSDVMRAATRAGFDPETSAVPATAEELKVKAMYAKLSPAAVKVYKAARDHYAEARKARQEIAGGVLTAAHKNLIATAEASGDAAKIKKAKDKLKKQLEKLDAKYKEVKGPYFPLMRLGKWYVVGMSKELAALEEIDNPTKGDQAKISAMRKTEKHYTTSSYETKSQAEAAERALAKRYSSTRLNRAEEKSHAAGVLSAAGLQDVENYINSSFDKDVASEIRTMMAELYYEALPEHHALKHEMKREGVHGEEQDMRRVFAVSTIKSAHYMSRLKYADDLKSALFAIRREGKKSSDAMQYYNEVVKRAKLSMDETSAPWADKVAAVSYLAHLGMNPAFVLTNASQVAMITAPWLAARTSVGKTTAALGSAYRVAGDLIMSSYKAQGWRAELDWGTYDETAKKWTKLKVPEGVANMLLTLLKRNLLDITIEHDLGATAELKNHALGDALKIGNLPVHITELANRTVTAIAAYNLAINELKMGQAEAEEFASKAVSTTQLDYSALNAPRHMQRVFGSAPAARIVMQFRKYQQGMLWLIGRSIYNALKSASPKEKAEAKKTLVGLFTTTGIMAGSLGMPLAGTAMWSATLVASLFGDDDEPWDARTEYLNWLTEVVGKDAAIAVVKGVPAWMLGIDLEKRVGLGDIASPLPFMRQGKTAQEDAANALLAAAGAPVGTMVDIWDGVGMMGNGDWWKGAEKIVPLKGIQNLSRGARYGMEGMTERDGDTILPSDAFSIADIGSKMLGFATTKESVYYEATSAVKGAQQAAMDARKKLLAEFAQTRMANESSVDVMEQVRAFNKRHPEKGVRIDASSLVSALKSRKLAERQRGESGLLKSKQVKPFLKEASFAE